MVPSVLPPPPPAFPVPPYPLSQLTRNQIIPHVRAVLKHIGPRGLDIGYGYSKAWCERFPVNALSEKTRSLLGPDIETVAMADFRLFCSSFFYFKAKSFVDKDYLAFVNF